MGYQPYEIGALVAGLPAKNSGGTFAILRRISHLSVHTRIHLPGEADLKMRSQPSASLGFMSDPQERT